MGPSHSNWRSFSIFNLVLQELPKMGGFSWTQRTGQLFHTQASACCAQCKLLKAAWGTGCLALLAQLLPSTTLKTCAFHCAPPHPSVGTRAPNTMGSQHPHSWTTCLHPRPLSFGHSLSSDATLFPMPYSPPPPLPVLVSLRNTKHYTSFLLRNPLQDLFRAVKSSFTPQVWNIKRGMCEMPIVCSIHNDEEKIGQNKCCKEAEVLNL